MAHRTIQGQLNSSGMRFAIVASRFNDFVTSRLLGGALDALERTVRQRPTLPLSASGIIRNLWRPRSLSRQKYDAVICLGTLIRGETPHFDYISSEVTKGSVWCLLNRAYQLHLES
jgi:6,7-dimethyl-8-ribityllumazine synthase